MAEDSLKEVWLLTCNPNGTTCTERVFAEMGEVEITKVSREIADTVYSFRHVIAQYVAATIREELAKGETEIHISADDDDASEYILVKMGIDSGCDWFGEEVCDVDPDDCEPVRKVDTVYASLGYYDQVECLFSYELEKCRKLTVE